VAHLSSALVHLGEVAYRTGRALRFDPKTGTILGDDDANGRLTKPYRALGIRSGLRFLPRGTLPGYTPREHPAPFGARGRPVIDKGGPRETPRRPTKENAR
jgi:hypothetical protein